MQILLDERYATQVKAVDAAFIAQQTAMQTALLAAEKAVQTALTAAEKAVVKAETAAEKRFDAVNEFRGAYQDIISQQLPRVEADSRFKSLSEKLDTNEIRFNEKLNALALRTENTEASTTGSRLRSTDNRLGNQLLIASIGLAVVVISIVISVITLITH